MSDYNFTKIKKSQFGGQSPLSKELRITISAVSIAGDVFNSDKEWLKLDVDASKKAIRVRKGTVNGKRSYAFQRNDVNARAIAIGLPKAIRELLRSGKLAKGTYKQVDDSNIFVLV